MGGGRGRAEHPITANSRTDTQGSRAREMRVLSGGREEKEENKDVTRESAIADLGKALVVGSTQNLLRYEDAYR